MSAPASDAEKVVRAKRPELRKCYDDALKGDAKVAGVVKMVIKVGPDGDVTSASPSGDTSLPGAVVACLAKVLASSKFAPPGTAGMTLELPLSFSRKAE